MFLIQTLLFSLGISGLCGLFSLWIFKGEEGGKVAAQVITSFVVNVIVIFIILWFGLPAHTGLAFGYAWLFFPLAVTGALFWVIGSSTNENRYTNDGVDALTSSLLPFGVSLLILICCIWGFWSIRTQGDATQAAQLAKVTTENASTYPATDTNHLVQVPEEYATLKANTSIGQATLGNGINISTAYQTGTPVLQAVDGHLYWVFPLEFSHFTTWRQVNGIVPGYIVVDAEDPDAAATLRLGYNMRYNPSSYLGDMLQRHIYSNGYSSYKIDDLTLEVDDTWKPYFTASLNQFVVNNATDVPVGMIIVDPQTGAITHYDLDKVPSWVDRVYSQRMAKTFMNLWGDYADKTNPWRLVGRSNAARYQVNSDPVLVYTTINSHPAWQMTLTSLNKDTSITSVVLFDARDNRAYVYPILGGTAVETQVATTMQGIPQNQNKRYTVTHLSVHKIYGKATWVANYILPDNGSYQGIGFMTAGTTDGADVAYALTKEQALDAYRVILARNPDNKAPGQGAQSKTIQGKIGGIASEIQGGNTVYLFWLSEDPHKIYKAGYAVSHDLAFARVGDTVVVIYIDYGQPEEDVSQFTDQTLPIH